MENLVYLINVKPFAASPVAIGLKRFIDFFTHRLYCRLVRNEAPMERTSQVESSALARPVDVISSHKKMNVFGLGGYLHMCQNHQIELLRLTEFT